MRESSTSGDTKVLSYPSSHRTPRYPHQQQLPTALNRNTTNNAEIVSLPSIHIKMPEDIPRPSSCNSSSSTSSMSSSGSNSLVRSTPAFQAQWLFFSNSRWIPLDMQSHSKLERTLQLGGVFVDIEDSHFPDVQRIRVFPGADYLSYLGIRYRISRVLLPL
ncbi:hypothetical protein BJV82DRAFT_614749 [Fennellomyces sp. T-0311]|nr:hypothetical protein BJV82DRAFT_614749 [Fennellomyces sp. T-0311]